MLKDTVQSIKRLWHQRRGDTRYETYLFVFHLCFIVWKNQYSVLLLSENIHIHCFCGTLYDIHFLNGMILCMLTAKCKEANTKTYLLGMQVQCMQTSNVAEIKECFGPANYNWTTSWKCPVGIILLGTVFISSVSLTRSRTRGHFVPSLRRSLYSATGCCVTLVMSRIVVSCRRFVSAKYLSHIINETFQ